MPYALHSRLTFSGVFGTVLAPHERWSFRLNLGPVTVGNVTPAVLQECVDAFVQNIASEIGSQCRLTEVKHARIGADGRYTADPDILATDAPGAASTSALYPPQVSVAVSLMTATRGARGRGRIYLPGPRKSLGADGVMSATDAQAIASSANSFVGAINAVGALGTVVVASSFGANNAVTGVRVGRALDTIRSRRTSLSEAYGAALVTSQVAD